MNIDEFLKKRGENKTWLAGQLGITHSAVVKHARGQSIPRPGVMAKYALVSEGLITATDFYAPTPSIQTEARAGP